MMLKLKQNYKNKLKIFGAGAAICVLGSPILSFYTVPERVSAVTWFPTETRKLEDITTMQEMNKYICDNSEIGAKNQKVVDIRDNSTYSIGKLADGSCWMTQNLRITRESIQEKDPKNTTGLITSEDSNIEGDYEIKESIEIFPFENTGEFVHSPEQDSNGKVSAQGLVYGAYYSWCALTANTCTELGVDATEVENATFSICPRGWRLPTAVEYSALSGGRSSGWSTAAIGGVSYNGYYLGDINSDSAKAAFFPAAGVSFTSGLSAVGTRGHYWSGTTKSASATYRLNFEESSLNFWPAASASRALGCSARCVANETILESVNPDEPIYTDFASGDLTVKVGATISIDAVSGMTSTVTPSQITTGNITATVATNATSYQVLLHAEETALLPKDTVQNTHSISTSTEIAPNKTGWGILNADKTTYSAMATKPTQYYNESSTQEGVMGTIHSFGVGVSVSSTLPADTYSTQVTVTAAAV